MTREQLKKEAQQFINNPNLMVADGYGYKWLKDLIARQDAYIDGLEVEIEDLKQAYIDVQRDP